MRFFAVVMHDENGLSWRMPSGWFSNRKCDAELFFTRSGAEKALYASQDEYYEHETDTMLDTGPFDLPSGPTTFYIKEVTK